VPFKISAPMTRYLAVPLSLLLATAAVTACSTSSRDSGGGSGAKDTVTWGTGTVTMFEAAPFVAMGLGIFDKHDIDAKFTVAPSAPTLLASGKAQILADRSANVPLLISQGKPVKALAALASNVPAGLLVSNKVETMADLTNLGGNCSLAASTGGILTAYLHYWVDKYNLKCKISVIQDYSLALSGVVSGRYTAAAELLSNAGAAVAKKQAHWLIDPTAADYKSSGNALPGSFINTALVSTNSYLDSHKDVVKRFIAAVQEANAKMKSMSNADIAKAIKASGAQYWASQSEEDIVNQLTGSDAAANVFELDRIGVDPISEKLWTDSLQNIKQQGVDIDPADPRFGYDQAVDSSFVSS
jgi:NitT/TauT family transport system substrate-binding protein